MKTSGLFRLGRDAELRYLTDNTPVMSVGIATNYGKKDNNGERPTQWIDATLFGNRAEILAPMLLRGAQHVFHMSDLHIEIYKKNDGSEGVKLAARIDDVELTARPADGQPRQQQPRQQNQGNQPRQQQGNQPRQGNGQQQPRQGNGQQRNDPARHAPRPSDGFEDMDSDIPF